MRRVFFSAIALVLVMSSSISSSKGKSTNSENTECTIVEVEKEKTICKKEPKGEVVEVLYFHDKQRCNTCRTIEDLTRKVIYKRFAKELKIDKLQLSIIDISTPTGEAIAHRYNVTKSSLFINKWSGGKEVIDNLTDMDFTMATRSPDEFKKQIEARIASQLIG